MSEKESLIKKIEEERDSKVLVYITSDREPNQLHGQIAGDVVPIFYEHLKKIDPVDNLDLFLYSQGGQTTAPWRIVNLLREYCDRFSVLIPYKAHSAATLLALGAGEIVMNPLAELSPIDPSIGSDFNPPNPGQQETKKTPVRVEDVYGYINLAKEKMDIKDQTDITTILTKLVENLHPLAIGTVYRTHELIRLLANKLLNLHMIGEEEERAIPQIIEDLAEKLYYHGYKISRREAKNLGLKVTKADGELEDLIWNLYTEYKEEIGLEGKLDPSQYENQDLPIEKELPIALIENTSLRSAFEKQVKINKQVDPKTKNEQLGLQVRSLGWNTTAK